MCIVTANDETIKYMKRYLKIKLWYKNNIHNFKGIAGFLIRHQDNLFLNMLKFKIILDTNVITNISIKDLRVKELSCHIKIKIPFKKLKVIKTKRIKVVQDIWH